VSNAALNQSGPKQSWSVLYRVSSNPFMPQLIYWLAQIVMSESPKLTGRGITGRKFTYLSSTLWYMTSSNSTDADQRAHAEVIICVNAVCLCTFHGALGTNGIIHVLYKVNLYVVRFRKQTFTRRSFDLQCKQFRPQWDTDTTISLNCSTINVS